MNENEQQIAIAEFCGFVKIGTAPFSNGRLEGIKEGVEMFLPDYLHDLNAMHEAEERLLQTTHRYSFYEAYLSFNVHATASQRSEALLHAIEKWVEK